MPVSTLARSELFAGLGLGELEELQSLMRTRQFGPEEPICRAGEPGDSLFLIVDGFARVLLEDAVAGPRAVARLRRGDVIGEMSLVTGEPRSATVVAGTPTVALELQQRDFAALIARHPPILANLNRILSRKLAETNTRVGERPSRGEAVALLLGEAGTRVAQQLVAATEAASPSAIASLDARASPEGALNALDDQLAKHRTVLVLADLAADMLSPLVDAVDRAVAVVGDEHELERLATILAHAAESDQRVEVVVLADSAEEGTRMRHRALPTMPVLRVVAPAPPLPADDAGWLGRHLSRTKLGFALGAGGAKGYAHVGALAVLEEAGYTVDCVSGSSIGAVIGAWLALGMNASDIEATLRESFRPEVVEAVFKLSFSGVSTGLETMTRVLRETTQDKTFAELGVPLVVMTVDLSSRRPAPVTEGPLWQALLAATALAGLFPPYERDGERLVDGLALVPVPTDAVLDAGADLSVSVNLISRDTLPAWPGEAPPKEEPAGPRSRMLDTLLEVMDLAQLDSSERHAARADVVVTPRFGPSTWRDFQLADLFLDAGRRAAEEQLSTLRSLARPQLSRLPT